MSYKAVKFTGKDYLMDVKDAAGESVLAEIFKHREYRSAEPIIRSATDPIIDAGAHLGFFTTYARALNDEVVIYALEPEKNNFIILKQNFERNGLKGIVTVEKALAGNSGHGTLLISPDSHNHRLLGDGESPSGKTVPVKTVSFPDLCEEYDISAISLLKMDIEGAEIYTVESLSRKDFEKIRAIIFEYHDTGNGDHKQTEKILRENGFSAESFPSKFDKNLGFIMARNKRYKK